MHACQAKLLRDEKLTPRLVWEQTKTHIITSPIGYLIFDDTVCDKNYSSVIELVRRQWSGNTKSVIRGVGIVTCIYVNPETDQFWLNDYRLFASDADGKTKLDHAKEMFDLVIHHKQLAFGYVLMDTWYATRQLMMHIARSGKIYYCPLPVNRQLEPTTICGMIFDFMGKAVCVETNFILISDCDILISLGSRRCMIMHDSPTVFRAMKDEREASVRIVVGAF